MIRRDFIQIGAAAAGGLVSLAGPGRTAVASIPRVPREELLRRSGFITVSRYVIKRNPQVLLDAFSRISFLPTDIRHEYFNDQVVYAGYSKHFELVADYCESPKYEISVTTDRDDKVCRVFLNGKEVVEA